MFYGSNENYNELNNFVDNVQYLNDNEVDFYRFDKREEMTSGKLDEILKFYEMHEGYVSKIVDEFKVNQLSSIGLENQVVELFNNVKSILVKGDKTLMQSCLKSILEGRENAIKFIDEQKEYMDDNTLRVMNTIISEYSHHVNYLNEAINIL